MKLLKSLTWLVVLALAIGFAGCSDDDDDDNTPITPTKTMFEKIVEVGDDLFEGGMHYITGDQVWEEMGQDDNNLFIIDWRATDAYEVGHVEGAHDWNFSDEHVLTDSLALIPAGAKVVNYCYSGQTASQASIILRMLGYDAYNLKFGACGWNDQEPWHSKAGDEDLNAQLVTTTTALPTPTEDYPTLSTTATDVEGAIIELANAYWQDGMVGGMNASGVDVINNENRFADAEDVFVVNYWPQAKYDSAHIDGAVCFDTGNVTLKSLGMEALSYLPKDKKIVVYCFTGQTSSHVAAYLRILGYDAYTLAFGMNGVMTGANRDILGAAVYAPPADDYPWVTE